MNFKIKVCAILLNILLIGCVLPERNGVKVLCGEWIGEGVIVDYDKILTVKHLVENPEDGVYVYYNRDNTWKKKKHDWRYGEGYWLEAKIIEEIPAGAWPDGEKEPLLLLQILKYKKDAGSFNWSGFREEDIHSIKKKIYDEPCKVITGRKSYPWGEEVMINGDSGSPVVDRNNNLIGLICGTIETPVGLKTYYAHVRNFMLLHGKEQPRNRFIKSPFYD
jgi:hypothetical protein